MSTAKEDLEQFLAPQPADVSKEELLRELAFELMVQRGISDSDEGKTISNDEMQRRINLWQQ